MTHQEEQRIKDAEKARKARKYNAEEAAREAAQIGSPEEGE